MSFFAVNSVSIQTQKKLESAKKARNESLSSQDDKSKKKKRLVKKVKKSGGTKHGSEGYTNHSDTCSLSSATTGSTSTSQFSHSKASEKSMAHTPSSVDSELPESQKQEDSKVILPQKPESQYDATLGSLEESSEVALDEHIEQYPESPSDSNTIISSESHYFAPKQKVQPLEIQLQRAVDSASNPVGLIYRPQRTSTANSANKVPGTSQGSMQPESRPPQNSITSLETSLSTNNRRSSIASSMQSSNSFPQSTPPAVKRSAAKRLSHKLSSTFLGSSKKSAGSTTSATSIASAASMTSAASLHSVESNSSSTVPINSTPATATPSAPVYAPSTRVSSANSIPPARVLNSSVSSMPAYSMANVEPNVEISDSPISQLLKKQSEAKRSPSSESQQPKKESLVPVFVPLFNLSLLNDTDTMETAVASSYYHVFRYNNFLEILSDHHHTDAINFAQVRLHSLFKVITRIGESEELIKWSETQEHHDIRFYESILASVLFSFRRILRKVMRQSQDYSQHTAAVIGEEMLQVNFTNYIRYLIRLPPLTPEQTKTLNEDESTHYRNKTFILKISHSLYRIKMDEMGVDQDSSSQDSTMARINLVIQSITKVANEYFILEKYHIHILAKMNQDSVIEKRLLKSLFQTYKENIRKADPESVKVLLYNTFYSAQYPWYMSLTTPFIRVFEANVCAERSNTPWNDEEKYLAMSASVTKTSFKKSDQELYDDYFKKLQFDSFESYRETSPKKLVDLHKLLDNQSSKYKDIKKHEIPDPSSVFSHKPMNFEHYSQPLCSIPSNSFHMVQMRDPVLQLTSENQKTILKEFKRILKPGGALEIPLIQLGNDSIKRFLDSKVRGGVSKGWGFMEHSLNMKFKFTPNLVESLLRDIKKVFGDVQYAIALVKSSNEINTFWSTHCNLLLYDMSGNIQNFWANVGIDKKPDIYYYIHIKAFKKE